MDAEEARVVCACLILNLIYTFHPHPSRRFPRSTTPITMDPAKLAKLQAQAAANRIGEQSAAVAPGFYASQCVVDKYRPITFLPGGKGTVRRKIVRKAKPSAAQDDKKLQGALKKLNVQPISGVEEVNMFREDGNVLHFTAPKGASENLGSLYVITCCLDVYSPRRRVR